ncbi:APC family permease [Sulfitobacter sp. M57]|uniref:APC family permease n=1 Tax=unclassified Sulfitobacter TaxID=196795 RepID=UPI0023E17EED|nr:MULTISPECIES: APC family permease [unclassified Sulfitobacter]MDF3416423.1 APC family permease [Sulfitobacter sp. KE5]MDF3423903.1 APC family permease [Sulfitobacter sp. KE43]MDF3434969.1 APC family permease [Sulfitobacter sp. KE42]MDF3460608.1 APC family permease [Sulfitobacter sp. S74]MDF3464506.1 APC family permease [Sulfitobacter sp. Ks18]
MQHDHSGADTNDTDLNKGSISLSGAVGMGTGVMIGAGIFALTGQIAQLAGPYFALSFVLGAIITSLSAYSYIKMSNAWPSSGGVAMILQKAYGPGAIAAAAALLMALSMVISESLVARTFATYVLRPFDISSGPLVPLLAVGVILFAFLVNVSGNRSVGLLSIIMAVVKIGGIAVFGIVALWVGGLSFPNASSSGAGFDATGFVASVALSILAFKGFTTITNSGGEITDPHRNAGRTIMISIAICVVIYLLVALAVGSNLTIDQIVAAKDYSLAEAAAPAFGQAGFYFTVVLAAVATASGVLASVFAVSRMLAMLTDMKMIPHRHFGMSGPVRSHTLVYTVVMASILAVFFDLSRIASFGAFFYLVMDMLVHWGVFRHLRHEIGANGIILMCALAFDAVVLAAFTVMKLGSDPIIVFIAAIAIGAVFVFQRIYLKQWYVAPSDDKDHTMEGM